MYVIFLCSLFSGVLLGFFNLTQNTKPTKSFVFSSDNSFHFHTYLNSIDHHYILFSNASTNSSFPEFEKLINPLFIRNNKVVLHFVYVNENQKCKRNVMLFYDDNLLPVDISKPSKDIYPPPIVIALNASFETLNYLEQIKLKYILPAPWLNAKQKIRLKNIASKKSVEFYDPEISGWRNLSF